MALVQPIIYDLGPWSAPWTELVRLRSEEWAQYVSNDRRFGIVLQQPPSVFPRDPIPVQVTVYLKTPRSRSGARGAPRVARLRALARARRRCAG